MDAVTATGILHVEQETVQDMTVWKNSMRQLGQLEARRTGTRQTAEPPLGIRLLAQDTAWSNVTQQIGHLQSSIYCLRQCWSEKLPDRGYLWRLYFFHT